MVDAFNPDIKRFPYFSKIKTAYAAVQGPGDIVFTPTGWWPSAKSAQTQISRKSYERKARKRSRCFPQRESGSSITTPNTVTLMGQRKQAVPKKR
jgi:hypothetical protein